MAKRNVGDPWHHFSSTNGQPQLDMAQPSTTVNYFDDDLLFVIPDYKEYDRPLGARVGKMSAYVLPMMIGNVKRNLMKWK